MPKTQKGEPKLDFDAMEKQLSNEHDPERDAFERGEPMIRPGLKVIFGGFDRLTIEEHAAAAVRRTIRNSFDPYAPKIPAVDRAHHPYNCSFPGCRTKLWAVDGQFTPFCDPHDTEENRAQHGYD